MDERILTFPAPSAPWSMNARQHWSVLRGARGTARAWRLTACMFAMRAWRRPDDRRMPPCQVEVDLPVTSNRRRDPHNWIGPVKAIVDGLVDAGVWPDDTPAWVTVTEPRLVPANRIPESVWGEVTVRLIPR